MKQKLKLLSCLLFLGMVLSKTSMAQKGPSCDSAVVLTYPISNTVTSYTASAYWFKVTLNAGNYNIKVANLPSVGKITKADVYTGTCSSLTNVKTFTLVTPADTILNVSINSATTTTYYVKLFNSGGSVTFNQTMASDIHVVGQIGFCPGQQVTLSAFPVNPSGSQTYTWLPVGSSNHASSYTVIPSNTVTATTYTLIYQDNGGILTSTVNIFPLGPNQCKSCEQVQNGHFEWYDGYSSGISNIIDSYFWTDANTGSSDYYNANFPVPSQASVPSNGSTTNTPAHNGNGYAGLVNFYANSNIREYIQSPLKCALTAGQVYNVSFFTTLADLSDAASDKIGAYLSAAPIFTANNYYISGLTPSPAIYSSSVINYSTSTTWTQISGNITGNNEQFITIGNFFDDASTNYTTSISSHSVAAYGGLSYYFIDDISVTPVPPTLSATTNTVNCNCVSNITLTATGSPSLYTTWSNGVNTYSGSVIPIPCPTATTIYTCTVNLPCAGCAPLTNTIAVNVIPNFTLSASASSTAICSGQTTTLTGIGANTYTWSPGALTGATVAVSPTVTTTYTVTGTYGNCTSTKTITINVSTMPSLTVTASPTVICAGSSSTLTATGASSYTWNPGALSGATVAVTPTVTTTYTATGVNGACSNTKTITVTVGLSTPISATLNVSNPFVCSGNTTTLSVVTSPTLGYTYVWSPAATNTASIVTTPTNNLVYSCTITDPAGCQTKLVSTCVDVTSTLCCSPAETIPYNTTISGPPFNTLSASGTYSMSGTITINTNCTWTSKTLRMASGTKIIINPGFTLTLDGCKLFSCQDMWEGIVILHNGTSAGNIVCSNTTIIEDAYRAIYYDGANRPYNDNISVQNSQLNKNYIGISVNNSLGYTINSYLVKNNQFKSAASSTSPGSNLKCSSYYTPTILARGYIGYQDVEQHSDMHIGSGSATGSILNTFDNLSFGYHGTNSEQRIIEAQFTNMISGTSGSQLTNPIGIAAYSIKTNTTIVASLRVNNSVFNNVWCGVNASSTNTVDVYDNNFNNSLQTSALCTSGCIANYAVKTENVTDKVGVGTNTITNVGTGVSVAYSQLNTTTNFSLSISSNTFNIAGSGLINQAISFSDASNNFGTSSANMLIVANKMTNVRNGISVTNVKNHLRISNNNIAIQYIASGIRTGIKFNGVEGTGVDNNIISSTGTANTNLRGIYYQISPNCAAQCNTITTVGQSVLFEGNCLSPIFGFVNNIMNTANDGLVLKNNGVIGTQGATTGSPLFFGTSGNQWLNTFTNSKTLVNDAGSSAQYSNLIIKNNTNEYPQPQSLNKTAGSAVSTMDNFGTSAFNVPASMFISTNNNYGCPSALLAGFRVAQPDSDYLAAKQQVTDAALYQLLQGPGEDAVIPNQTLEINKNYIYQLLANGYATQHQGLMQFYNSQADSVLATYATVDSLLQNQSYNAAQSQNNAAIVQSQIQQNQQFINEVLAKHLQNQNAALTQTDLDALIVLANKCPLYDGTAVYQARGLLQVTLNDNMEFTEDCEFKAPISKRKANIVSADAKNYYYLYPNPNNGAMVLQYQISDKAQIIIYDISGRQLYQQVLDSANNKVELHTTLSSGIYFYTIATENEVLKTDKLIIIK